jgi:hypothetical protein
VLGGPNMLIKEAWLKSSSVSRLPNSLRYICPRVKCISIYSTSLTGAVILANSSTEVTLRDTYYVTIYFRFVLIGALLVIMAGIIFRSRSEWPRGLTREWSDPTYRNLP